LIGTTIAHFKITAKLGAGGMGEVYRAEDTNLDREVALKILPADLVTNPDRVRRFVQEAKSASALSHPYIVSIHEIGEENDVHYIAMELVDGGTLKDKIHKEQVPFKQILGWLAQAAEGLAKAHSAGIIHRDLKPDNIMITRDGFAKVLDFGLAKLTEPLASDGSQAQTGLAEETEAGAVLGTVGYMSPEQVQGKALDPRSDVFSFGCMLYEAATRQRPFAGETAVDTMHQILRSDPTPVRELSPETPSVVRRLIRRTLAKDPEQRFQSMRDLAFELSDLAEEYDGLSTRTDSQSVSSSGALSPITDTKRSHRLLWIGGAVVATVALGLLALNLMRDQATEAPAGSPVQASFTQLTFQSGHESYPDFSPDGNFVVYAGTAGNSLDLFLLRVGGSNPINLTNTPDIREWSPAYSPDGQIIAFASDRDGGGIFVMGSTGEAMRRLTDSGSDPAWSPDGASIVFASETFLDANDRGNFSQLLVIPLAGGEATEIYSVDAMQPSWSPNGERIAFWALRGEGGIRDIATIPSAGGDAVWITDDAALDWNPVWSPDGSWLYFGSDRGGTMNLWRVAIDQQSGQVQREPEPLTTPSSSLGFFSIDRDGRRAVYTHQERSASIGLRAFDPTTLTIADESVTVLESSLPFSWIAPSPDGQRLALDAYGSINDLYVAMSDGTGLQRLTDESAKNRGPRWAPDGNSLVFYSDRSGSYQSWRINTDGSGLEQLTELDEIFLWPTISPDGRYLLVSDAESGSAVVDLNGPLPALEATILPTPDDPDLVFSTGNWAPDSARIVYVVYSKKTHLQESIAVYSLADEEIEILHTADPGQQVFFADWMQDGERILFSGTLEGGDSALMAVDLAGGAPQVVWRFTATSNVLAILTADNRSFVTLETQRSSDLWIADFQ